MHWFVTHHVEIFVIFIRLIIWLFLCCILARYATIIFICIFNIKRSFSIILNIPSSKGELTCGNVRRLKIWIIKNIVIIIYTNSKCSIFISILNSRGRRRRPMYKKGFKPLILERNVCFSTIVFWNYFIGFEK